MKKFCGCIPPVSSTFTQDGKVAREAAKRLADYLIEHGVHGLFYPKSRLMRPRFN